MTKFRSASRLAKLRRGSGARSNGRHTGRDRLPEGRRRPFSKAPPAWHSLRITAQAAARCSTSPNNASGGGSSILGARLHRPQHFARLWRKFLEQVGYPLVRLPIGRLMQAGNFVVQFVGVGPAGVTREYARRFPDTRAEGGHFGIGRQFGDCR